MNDKKIAIRVRNLGKKYTIGGSKEKYHTMRDAIIDSVKAPFKRFNPTLPDEGFWALKEVSFDVEQGEVIGIIGRNGAGKSTLLKILSRITPPTEGKVELYGRVGSLLEVGTGFHPELTGRDNIFLSGSILGMKKREIESKLDDIVKFSEIEKFLDTPVKRYSSGMYVRLAFAVAAHMDTEILLVDEVLAVGDAAFQKKCMGKMGDVAKGGKTVLFVSHNMGAIQSICQRGVWINDGTIFEDGDISNVVNQYLKGGANAIGKKTWADFQRPGNECIKLCSVTLKDSEGNITAQINISEEAVFEIEYEVIEGTRAQFSLVLFDASGSVIFGSLSNSIENKYHNKQLNAGKYCSKCHLYGNLLNEGRYYVSIIGMTDYWMDGFRSDHILSFDAVDDGVLKGDYPGGYGGVIRPKFVWNTEPLTMKNDTGERS